MKSKRKRKYLVLIIWVIIIVFLAKNHLITLDLEAFEAFLTGTKGSAMLIFIFLWCVRIFAFIPGFIFMIIGGVYFGPIIGSLLSLIGITLSETIIFVISKTLLGSKLKNFFCRRYPEVIPLLEKYNYRFLALGILFPVAPTDAICFLSASVGIRFRKFIATVIFANLPVILVYSYLGTNFDDSVYSAIFMLIIGILIILYSLRFWKKFKNGLNSIS